MMGRRGMLSVAVLALLAEIWAFSDESVDDAFISFRYAQNLWRHGELAYNHGEPPVEGFSNLLWTVLCAPVALFDSPLVWSRGLSLLLLVSSLGLLVSLARRVAPELPWAGALSLACCASAPGFVYWHFTGLEVPLVTTLLLLCVWTADRDEARARPLLFVPLAALALTRIDAIVPVAACLLGSVSSQKLTRSRILRTALAGFGVLLVLGAYELFRLRYFGDALPNTLRAKSGAFFSSAGDGLAYVVQPFTHAPLLGLALFAPVWLRGREGRAVHVVGTALVMGVVQLVYVVSVGGDWMPLYRFVAPFVPLLALVTVFVLDRVLRQLPAERALARHVVPVAVMLSPLVGLGGYALSGAPLEVHVATEVTELGRLLGTELATRLPAHARTADGTAGSQPYFSGRPNIDMFGLTDRTIARARVSRFADFLPIGHRTGDGYEVLSRRPDALVFVVGRSSSPGEYVSEAQLAFDPRFHAYYELSSFTVSRPPTRAGFLFTDVQAARPALGFAALDPLPQAFGTALVRRAEVELHVLVRVESPRTPARAALAEIAALMDRRDFVAAARRLEREQPLLANEGLGAIVPAMLSRIWLLAGDERRARGYLDMAQRMLTGDYRRLFEVWIRVDPWFEPLLEKALGAAGEARATR